MILTLKLKINLKSLTKKFKTKRLRKMNNSLINLVTSQSKFKKIKTLYQVMSKWKKVSLIRMNKIQIKILTRMK